MSVRSNLTAADVMLDRGAEQSNLRL